MSRLTLLLALSLTVLMAVVHADGAMVGVNAYAEGASTTLSPGDTAGAPGYEQPNWNNVDQDGASSVALVDANGGSSGMTISYPGNFYGGETGWGSATADDRLMNGGHRYHSANTMTFEGLTPGEVYDIVFYWGFTDGRAQDVNASDATGTTTIRMTTTPTKNAWVEATAGNGYTGNYLVLAGLTVKGDGTLSVDLDDGTSRTSFSAIQLRPIPEPGVAVMLALGGVALLRRRR